MSGAGKVADEADAAAVRDPAVLRDGYEQLRERVLAGRPDGWRLGHALLARRGVAGWIAEQPAAASAPRPSAPAPTSDCGQIVSVLAEMALAHAA